jgi:hypothetical protein
MSFMIYSLRRTVSILSLVRSNIRPDRLKLLAARRRLNTLVMGLWIGARGQGISHGYRFSRIQYSATGCSPKFRAAR